MFASAPAFATEGEITRDIILNDPDAPTAGNPRGDLTIVDFFDYNCPFCKSSAPHLERLMETDGKIRLALSRPRLPQPGKPRFTK